MGMISTGRVVGTDLLQLASRRKQQVSPELLMPLATPQQQQNPAPLRCKLWQTRGTRGLPHPLAAILLHPCTKSVAMQVDDLHDLYTKAWPVHLMTKPCAFLCSTSLDFALRCCRAALQIFPLVSRAERLFECVQAPSDFEDSQIDAEGKIV